jgi:microcystin-dependent protein
MSDQYLGEIRNFGFNYAPQGWALCAGQLLAISQNTALFSLLGTNFGGDGRSTFGLPNLQGNMPIGQGQGPSLTNRVIGETGGSATVVLTTQGMPAHTHGVSAVATGMHGTSPTNGGGLGGLGRGASPVYESTPSSQMAPASIQIAGSGNAHNNMMPYLTTNFCIALQGVFPQRP